MRIAMVGCRGIPARAGGIERVVEELTTELMARGHEIIVYGRRHYVPPGEVPAAGRCIITPGLSGKHLDTITHTATAMLDLPRRNVDLVHIHSPGPALLSWLATLARVPIVFTVHAPDWRRDRWSSSARRMIACGLRVGMRLASAVTAVSRSLADELSGRFGRPVEWIPNAARTRKPLAPRAIRRWSLWADGYALHVGRLVPEKRLHLLLRAWRQVQASVPLVIAGAFAERSYERRCRKLAEGLDIRFVGCRYGDVLTELYSNAAIVVQPSVLEGMSLVLLEAADLGRCIIAADIPANREVLNDAGAYCTVESASELACQIRRCLNDEGVRTEKGRQARRRVRERFSWAGTAERMEKVYLGVRETG